ncbi:8-amino-7-oxononanoate synthase-like isoform X3 [Oryza brachyantha]|uniref:8-amino-7-oxononanoate synthase-like isoform X3 n=1 Tax=Oryza brachyantha TaxID=4533 RepID=UPI001ADCBA3E|nr:8-amino-7-oxononanoate synthase-like isoform X3 [Oryza brachyantha]
MAQWDALVDAALARLQSMNLLRATRPIALAPPPAPPETFDGPGPWDRAAVEIRLDDATLLQWLAEGGEADCQEEMAEKLILFSGNDYMGLSSHPAIRKAAVKAAQEYGMGPRGSALICGYTTYHKLVEESLAELKKKEDCLLCPTGFSANMAVMTALGSVSSLLSVGRKPAEVERIAVFSDALNHASIIDGIRLVERQQEVVAFVYRHCDMHHLDFLLLHIFMCRSSCSTEKKVVVTDSLFSMDGDFAPLPELVELRRKYGFLLVIDDAHGTLVCGKNGGGAPELFGCENDIDISVGTLSKAAGCQGGFIVCSNRWKRLIQSRGRSFIFSTALPVPVVASVHAALHVSRKERWRRSVIWRHVQYFASLTKLKITSPIISVVVGSEEAALRAGRHMLRSGFHVTPIRPPTVPQNSCRLRITLSASHSSDDIKRLVDALSPWLPDKHAEQTCVMAAKL